MSTETIHGIHATRAVLRTDPRRVHELLLQAGRADQWVAEIRDLAAAAGVAVREISRQEIGRLSMDSAHQGVLAIVDPALPHDESWLNIRLTEFAEPVLLLVLDGITDPHNLGACLRSAEAAGVQAVILPRDNSVALTPVVRKVACGAAELVPVVAVTNLARCLGRLKAAGIWLVGAVGEAEQSIHEIDCRGSVAVVMGAEGHGLRRLTREACDYLARIPMRGTVASLNVSVATGICLFEVLRQRGE